MTFHIWYADGSEVEGEGIEQWRNCPNDGVVAVGSKFDKGGRFCNGSDWYWWTEGGVDGGESSDIRGWWILYDGPASMRSSAKRGLWVDDETMRRVHMAMIEWMG